VTLESILATVFTAISTWETAKCVIFWREWREDRMKFLRERFGRDALSDLGHERAVFNHHIGMLVVWIVVTALSWDWLIAALGRSSE
jgi:hypothetical protein